MIVEKSAWLSFWELDKVDKYRKKSVVLALTSSQLLSPEKKSLLLKTFC